MNASPDAPARTPAPRSGPPTDPPAGAGKSEQAYRWLRERLAGERYAPGHRLVLGTIADELDMSVVPVREAIRRLEAEGLVTFERHVGARVSLIDDTQYRHSMETLAMLEGAATALAAPHLTAEHVAQARRVNRRLVEQLDDFDPRLFTSLNHRFHAVLFAVCPNPRLLALVDAEWARLGHLRDSTFTFVPDRARESVREHEALLDLIVSGASPADVERAARAHRSATLAAYLAREHPDEAPVPTGATSPER
ncbi:GntR family transcriptional regulator [Cellulomonas sp. H30R-01]|nr:GntR family transcriptional regulator [Cellulomonas sp. H30R-01]